MTHTEPTPRSLDEYLAQLRSALAGADSAMIQDALSDAESHLRAEFAARAGESEESVLRSIVGSYGSPADVASAYRETERTVQAANAPAAPARSATSAAADTGALRRFFGIYGDVHAWTALFYMGLSLLTGIFYFVFVVTASTSRPSASDSTRAMPMKATKKGRPMIRIDNPSESARPVTTKTK